MNGHQSLYNVCHTTQQNKNWPCQGTILFLTLYKIEQEVDTCFIQIVAFYKLK